MIETASIRPLALDDATHQLVDYLTAARLRLQRLQRAGLSGDQMTEVGELDRCFDALLDAIVPAVPMDRITGS